MAKKKSEQVQNQQKQINRQPTMDDNSEKVEHLKSLNALLLKETVERRHQVDSLQISNVSLESELTRSKSEEKALLDELTQVSDISVLLEMEKSLVFLFISVQMSQQSEAIFKEMNDLEMKFNCLEKEMREILKEKTEKETEIVLLQKKISESSVEIQIEKQNLEYVSRDRDEIRSQLDVQVEEADGMRGKLVEMDNKQRDSEDVICRLNAECKSLMAEKEEKERRLESLKRDMDSIERCLGESNRIVDELKKENMKISKDMEEVEEVKSLYVVKNTALDNEVIKCNEDVMSLRKEKEILKAEVLALQNDYAEIAAKEKASGMKIDVLVEEKEIDEKNIKKLVEEKGLLIKNMNEVLENLEKQKSVVELITQEKVEVENAKNLGEKGITELKIELGKFKDNILVLEESCEVQVERIKKLESEVSQSRDEANCIRVDRDKVLNELEKEKLGAEVLTKKVLENEKQIQETKKVSTEMNSENRTLIEEKKLLSTQNSDLIKDKTLLEENLTKTQKEFDAIKAKTALADANKNLILALLTDTAKSISLSSKTDEECLFNEQKGNQEMKPFVSELEKIKKAVSYKEVRVEEMKREVETLKDSVIEAHKKKSFWTLVSSATTILAAASVAYVARGH